MNEAPPSIPPSRRDDAGFAGNTAALRDRLITAIAHGYADLDWSALGVVAAEEAGLTVDREPAAVRTQQR